MADSNQPTLQTGATVPSGGEAEYLRTLRQTLLTPIAGALIGSVFYGVIALQQGIWQVAMGSVGLLTALVLVRLAYRLAEQGHTEAPGWLIVACVAVAYGFPELFWTSATTYIAGGGTLLIVTIATLSVRHNSLIKTAMAVAAYLSGIALVNALQPFPRYDIEQVPSVFTFIVVITGVMALATTAQLLRAFRIGTLRTRLLIAFAGLVLLPVAATGGISSTIGATYTRQRAADFLSAIGALKAAEINSWINGLQLDLRVEVARDVELGRLTLLLTQPTNSAEYQAAYQSQRARFQGSIDLRQNFEELMLLDTSGQVRLSTEPLQEGKNFSTQAFFNAALGGPHVNPPSYVPSLDRFVVYAGVPVIDGAGRTIGVVAGHANLKQIDVIMAKQAGLGETGEAYLVGANFAVLTALRYPFDSRYMRTAGPLDAITTQGVGNQEYNDYRGLTVIGIYHWVPELQVALIVEQDRAEAFQSSTATLTVTGVVTVLILLLAVVAALLFTRSIANPISQLAKTAEQIAAGDSTVLAAVERDDELGALARSFNSMTEQVRGLIGSLEDRVAARTEELRASAEVGRAAASILDTDQLLRQVVNLIVERFGLYYAAVFTLDETGRFAVLREATGEAGRTLKEQQHQLAVGGQSMVGYVTAHRQARIALDVGHEAVRFANPLLPDTRSEMALPLLVGDRALGALDVQSTRVAAFDEASAAVLQAMADQVAVALSNAEQFKQTNLAWRRARDLYTASQALSAASDPDHALLILLNHIAPDAHRGRVIGYGPRQADGELSYVEVIATWAEPDSNDPAFRLPPDARLTPQQMPLVYHVKPDQPFSVADRNQPGVDPAVRDLLERFDTQALIALPLTIGQKMVGLVMIGYRTPREFNAADTPARQALVGQTAIVLQNLQSAAETQAALAQLDAANRRLTGEAWADFTHRPAATGLRWIGTPDRASSADFPEVSEAISSGQIATRPLPGRGQVSIAVPIKLRDVSIGAIRVVAPRPAWDDDLRASLQAIAGHVAQAVENARLLEQTERDAQREKAISGAADKIHRATGLDTVLQTAIAEINRITGLAGVSIQLGFGQAEAAEDNGHGAIR